ncbi:hypothetical protein AK812_SmicGene28693 [Symbiodinium microadriaticum]|uniref:Uncharacterized protein n=1 Tax=Symbiodinium microadriaticum TaxID=2951 RepID=A0A1Q9D3Q2_SYMMI|nr:hypothetical protein AK812_SmicGene28693 [Symbiodinium microadriaticum]
MFWPREWTRRRKELSSGYAGALLLTAAKEVQCPKTANAQELRKLADPRGFAQPLLTSAVSAVGLLESFTASFLTIRTIPARMDVESTPERSFVDDAAAYRQELSNIRHRLGALQGRRALEEEAAERQAELYRSEAEEDDDIFNFQSVAYDLIPDSDSP